MKFFRRIYFYLKLKIYKKIGFLKKIFTILFSIGTFIFFIDKIFVQNLLLKSADIEFEQAMCQNAMQLYEPLSVYYGLFNLGSTHKQINAKIKYSMGTCYTLSGNKKRGTNYVEAGLMYLQQDLGFDNKIVADYLRKYSSTYYLSIKDYKRASNDINQAYATYSKLKIYGNEPADALRVYGDINLAQGQYDNAIFYYQRSFDRFSKVLFVDYDEYTKLILSMANYYNAKEDDNSVISTYEKALTFLQSSHENNKLNQAVIFKKLADVYFRKEDYKNAKKNYELALGIIKTLPKNNILRKDIVKTKTNLADSYLQTNDVVKEREMREEIYRDTH